MESVRALAFFPLVLFFILPGTAAAARYLTPPQSVEVSLHPLIADGGQADVSEPRAFAPLASQVPPPLSTRLDQVPGSTVQGSIARKFATLPLPIDDAGQMRSPSKHGMGDRGRVEILVAGFSRIKERGWVGD